MKFGLAAWLEIINGAWAMAALCLLMVCGAYLAHEVLALRIHKRREFTLGMRVASATGTIWLGVLITATGWAFGWQMPVRVLGGVVGLIGFICAIREYSRTLFGELVWVLATAAILMAAALMALPHIIR